MSNTYAISDTHWGHQNIRHYRTKFTSIEEHDGFIMDNILRTVGKRDILWLLGDCFFDEAALVNLIAINKRCQAVHFIPGNHDTDTKERQEVLRKIVKDNMVSKFGSMMTASGFWLTHPPMHPRELYGKVNVHGHVHVKTVPDTNYINVSCENVRYTPVNLNALKDPNNCKDLLVHYGPYEHICDDYRDGTGIRCLLCENRKE